MEKHETELMWAEILAVREGHPDEVTYYDMTLCPATRDWEYSHTIHIKVENWNGEWDKKCPSGDFLFEYHSEAVKVVYETNDDEGWATEDICRLISIRLATEKELEECDEDYR
jgi:hypothetical protein